MCSHLPQVFTSMNILSHCLSHSIIEPACGHKCNVQVSLITAASKRSVMLPVRVNMLQRSRGLRPIST